MKVELRKPAEKAIESLIEYLIAVGNPANASNYNRKIFVFIDSLQLFHKSYTICKYPVYAKRNFFCAVFDKKYVVAFKVVNNNLVIYKFVLGAKLKY